MPVAAEAGVREIGEHGQSAVLDRDVQGMRIGLSPDYFRITYPDPETGELRQEPIDPEIEAAVLRAAGRLAELGADIVEDIPLPRTPYGVEPIPAAVACRLARMRAKSRAFQREVAPDIDAMSDRSGGGVGDRYRRLEHRRGASSPWTRRSA